MKRYVFDSFALIAFFAGEPEGEKVKEVLRECLQGKAQGFLSVINWGEIFYIIARKRGQKMAQEVLEKLEDYPLKIIEADKNLTLEAARLKARYPIAYADCFALALAKLKRAELITGDPEFKKAAKEKVRIRWL